MMASGFVHARGCHRGKHAKRGANRAPVLHQARGLRTWRIGALALLGWAVFHGRRAGMVAQLHAVLVKQADTISPNRADERPIFPEHAHCPLALNLDLGSSRPLSSNTNLQRKSLITCTKKMIRSCTLPSI